MPVTIGFEPNRSTPKRPLAAGHIPAWRSRARTDSATRGNSPSMDERPQSASWMRLMLGISLICLLFGGLGILAGANWAASAIAFGVTTFVGLIALCSAIESAAINEHRRHLEH
jgi:hypothetical protein